MLLSLFKRLYVSNNLNIQAQFEKKKEINSHGNDSKQLICDAFVSDATKKHLNETFHYLREDNSTEDNEKY